MLGNVEADVAQPLKLAIEEAEVAKFQRILAGGEGSGGVHCQILKMEAVWVVSA
ncbi:hypothetical protein D3C87_2085930 [compost metagenome]